MIKIIIYNDRKTWNKSSFSINFGKRKINCRIILNMVILDTMDFMSLQEIKRSLKEVRQAYGKLKTLTAVGILE